MKNLLKKIIFVVSIVLCGHMSHVRAAVDDVEEVLADHLERDGFFIARVYMKQPLLWDGYSGRQVFITLRLEGSHGRVDSAVYVDAERFAKVVQLLHDKLRDAYADSFDFHALATHDPLLKSYRIVCEARAFGYGEIDAQVIRDLPWREFYLTENNFIAELRGKQFVSWGAILAMPKEHLESPFTELVHGGAEWIAREWPDIMDCVSNPLRWLERNNLLPGFLR